MDDLHLKQTEKRCFSVLSGTSKNSEEFMDSPTFFLSRAAMRDRLWLLIFLEALIAIENGSEEYFETDYIMAVNEYLVRRSDLSVRMLNTWIGGQNFRSMQEVTDFFNDRYRVTGQFFRDNQLLCRREWQEAASVYRARWIEAVRAQEDIPEELAPYDAGLGERRFRENPVQYLLGIREEERLHYIALIAACICEYEHAAGTNVAVRSEKSSVDFVRDFGNLLNTYIKYPEDPEIQTLTLMVHMDMNSRDFKDDLKRKSFFNEYLRSAAYKWHTNSAGCRRAVSEKWEEYGPLFRHLPQDDKEPGVPELYLDEAVLNIPEFQKDVDRLNLIAERFSKIGSLPEPRQESINEVIWHVVNYLKPRSSAGVKINCHLPEQECSVMMNASLFEWVIENLCKNAIDAMEGKGRIDITVKEEPKRLAIEIADTGKGIAKGRFKSVFEPGYTTKKRGWGLGLSLAKRIVEKYHKGKIFVKSSELGKGTTFRIELKK